MSVVTLAIIIFAIISAAASSGNKTQRGPQPGKRPWDQPWQPPAAPPRRVSTGQRGQGYPAWPKLEELDPNKEQELTQSAGKEGEWGDEGRSGMTLFKPDPTPRPSEAPPVATMGDTSTITNDPVPVEDPVPDVLNSGNPLVNGIIWSEILGRPRALRPYRGPRG